MICEKCGHASFNDYPTVTKLYGLDIDLFLVLVKEIERNTLADVADVLRWARIGKAAEKVMEKP